MEMFNLDLSQDTAAAKYIKHEVVEVVFAKQKGELLSREGTNRYRRGDALITGSTGDCWSVSRDRFEARYMPVAPTETGNNGMYCARPTAVLAKQMHRAFSILRSPGGDVLRGQAKDWVLQYAPADYGVVENARFRQVYRLTGN